MALCMQETASMYQLWTAYLNQNSKGNLTQMISNYRFWKYHQLFPNVEFLSAAFKLKVIGTEGNRVARCVVLTFDSSTEMD